MGAGHNLNQITSAGYAYDAAGNVTSTASDSVNAAYDEENRIKSANGFTYTYDADGERVEKSNGATGTLYWYMSPGIIGESDLNGVMKSEYVFFAGERIARRDYPSGSVAYYFSDHLKTTSIVTDSSGVIKNESDYYPWGGEVQLIANDSNHYKFNGKERDETGLDYYGARYYSNKLGRFVTPDWAGNAAAVPYANFGNPQSLNLYTYVENNPTTLADLDGHIAAPQSGSPFDCWNSCLNGGIHYGEFCGLDFGPCPPPHHYDPRANIPPGCKACDGAPQQGQQGQSPSIQEQVNDMATGAAVGAAIGGVAGATAGGAAGASGGAAGGTLVMPGAGTAAGAIAGGVSGAEVGAVGGAVAGAAVGATAGLLYSQSKDALNKIGQHLATALEHLNKLRNNPDWQPRKKWKETVRKSADNIDKQASRVANKHLRNTAHFVAQLLRGLAE